MKWFVSHFRRFGRAQEGLAFTEFALALPFLLALLLGAVEVTRYILIVQKLEKISVTISDLVSQSETMSTTQLDQLILAAGQVMLPYTFSANGYVIISSVTKTGVLPPKVNWQYKGGGTAVHTSNIGTTGNTANLPQDFTMADKENVIITEVYYNYTPIVPSYVLANQSIYKFAIFKPRLGDLSTLSP